MLDFLVWVINIQLQKKLSHTLMLDSCLGGASQRANIFPIKWEKKIERHIAKK